MQLIQAMEKTFVKEQSGVEYTGIRRTICRPNCIFGRQKNMVILQTLVEQKNIGYKSGGGRRPMGEDSVKPSSHKRIP